MIPTLHTDRLTLRPFRNGDFDAYATFMAGERTQYMDGKLTRAQAWGAFCGEIASWSLNGFGTLAIEEDGQIAGGAGLIHPPHFPEPECGWFLFDGFTGRGLATEAGRAMLDHTFATTDLTSIVSYVSEGNAASIRVAERLGAVRDNMAKAPESTGTLVYRHTKGTSQ